MENKQTKKKKQQKNKTNINFITQTNVYYIHILNMLEKLGLVRGINDFATTTTQVQVAGSSYLSHML